MKLQLIKFIHMVLTCTTLGLLISNYYYTLSAIKQTSVKLVRYTLGLTLKIDVAIFLFICATYLTCSTLVLYLPDLNFSTTWIQAACFLLSLVLLAFLSIIMTKIYNLKKIRHDTYISFVGRLWFHIGSIFIIILLVLIIRDAVMRSTFLPKFL